MRFILVIATAAIVGGCATSQTATYVRTGAAADRTETAINQLECSKVKLVAYRNALRSYSAADSYARVKAQAAANNAFERCAVAHGYRRVR